MKTAIVTGATSGIGLAAVKALACEGWRVLLVGHTPEKGAPALAAIRDSFPQAEAAYFSADLMQQRQVHRLAEELIAYLNRHCGGKLDALINNAGAVSRWYTTTEEGYEQQFAVNHLSGFLLTHLLMEALIRGGGRVLITGSGSHRHCRVHWDDVMYQRRRYSLLGAYKQSKLCSLLFAAEFNRRHLAQGVRAYVVDPGLVSTDIGFKQTGGLPKLVWAMRKAQGTAPEVPAKTYAYLCAAPEGETELYYYACKPAPYDRHAKNAADQRRLYALSEKLCGIAAS